jgi:hypothetical protein
MDMASLRKQHRPKYAALSYVWGAAGSQALNLHVRNLESLSSQLEGQIPPIAKTIRDAIGVTGRLGLQYIWVDSLCIIQKDVRYDDDPDARASQIEQMDSIFGHAAVTLVAADGLDAEAGLCGISTRPVRNQIARRIRPNVNVLLAVKYNNTYGKWDTRAWTLQEKLLSKRILIFNGDMSAITASMACYVRTCLAIMLAVAPLRFFGFRRFLTTVECPKSSVLGTECPYCFDHLSLPNMRICWCSTQAAI